MQVMLKTHDFESSATPGEQDLLISYAAKSSPSGKSPFLIPQDYNWRVLKPKYRNQTLALEKAKVIHFLGYPKPWELIDLATGLPRKVSDTAKGMAARFGPQHKVDFDQKTADEMMWAYLLWSKYYRSQPSKGKKE